MILFCSVHVAFFIRAMDLKSMALSVYLNRIVVKNQITVGCYENNPKEEKNERI